MKKKVGLISKISLMIALIVGAIGFSFMGRTTKSKQVVTRAYEYKQGVGLVDDNNIVLAVSKVAVNSNDEKSYLDGSSKSAYTDTGMYFYRDIPDLNNDSSKTLVENDSFVMLENYYSSKFISRNSYFNYIEEKTPDFGGGDTYYKIQNGEMIEATETEPVSGETYYVVSEIDFQYSKVSIDKATFEANRIIYYFYNGSAMVKCLPTTEFDSEEQYYVESVPTETDMEEAVLITFGQVAHDGTTVYYPNNSLHVDIYHNGEKMNDVPRARSDGYKRDFGFIIDQDEIKDISGHYKVVVNKDYFSQAGIQATQDVVYEFYVLNETDYVGKYVGHKSGTEYTAKPSLTLNGGNINKNAVGNYVYNVGHDSQEYPILNYDYTLYKMNYEHLLDGAIATYEYNYLTDQKIMQVTKKYRNQTTTKNITLEWEKTSNNIALLFSELGSYTFNFEYLYSGYNHEIAQPKTLKTDNIKSFMLDINGFEVNYSKRDYNDGVEMKYVTLSNADKLDLVVTDGYRLGHEQTEVASLGVMYDTNSDNNSRIGSVLKSQDANLQSNYSNIDYELLFTNILDYSKIADNSIDRDNDGTNESDLDTLLDLIKYETTDQNPIKIKTNQNFIPCYIDPVFGKITNSGNISTQGSFYIYSPNKITSADIFEGSDIDEESTNDKGIVKKYTSGTSLNEVGYYLMFMSVEVNETFSHYQVIAFNNVSQDVSTRTYEYNDDGTNGMVYPQYTDGKIKLYWDQPDVFEMKLKVSYYYKKYGNIFDHVYLESELYSTTPREVSTTYEVLEDDAYYDANIERKYCIIGDEIGSQESGKYIVVISNEKGNKWTTSFTIDKQDISGISGYGVLQNRNIFSLSSAIEDYISNTVVGEYGATLYWNRKPSGAGVKATYKMLPFVTNSDPIGVVDGGFTTSYKTGNAFDGDYSIKSPHANMAGTNVLKDNVLFSQGIYVFNLEDDAGNTAQYLFILDNTTTYFEVTEEGKTPEFKTAEYLQFSNVKLSIKAPEYKLIKFTDIDDEIEDVKEKINNSTLDNLLTDNYIKVKQSRVEEYNSKMELITNKAILEIFGGEFELYIHEILDDGLVVYDDGKTVKDDTTSVIRTYYMLGENQKYLGPTRDVKTTNSFVKVEINPDHALGYVYYSNKEITTVAQMSMDDRLVTGKTLNGAHMTNDSYLAFSWIIDKGGDYEVKTVKYDFYPLNLSQFDEDLYFFDGSNKISRTIYDNESFEIGKEDVEGRGLALINVENDKTQAGYYQLTRIYKNAITDGSDTTSLTYHFIVDRNGIITVLGGKNVGENINIALLENETEYNNFDVVTQLTSKDLGVEGIKYLPSLETNKLPTVVNIPIGKYTDIEGNYSKYYAGKLDFKLYFNDIFNQLGGGVMPYPLFEVDSNSIYFSKYYYYNNELYSIDYYNQDTLIKTVDFKSFTHGQTFDKIVWYYTLDLKGYVQKLQLAEGNAWANSNLNNFFMSGNDSNWICLPGDYVIVLSDRTEGAIGAHKKTIAFSILQAETPKAPVYVTPDEAYETDTNTEDYDVVSSQQYIKLEIPKYNINGTLAQIDYVEYNGRRITGAQNPDGSYTILLNTMTNEFNLREGEGQYRFLVRYKLGTGNKYQNSYYYYESGNKTAITYYQATYIVTIDRTAPQENLQSNLIANDKLAEFYTEDEMFEQAYYDNTANKTISYFVNRYKDYYNNSREKEDIFMFVVSPSTTFIKGDVQTVRFKSVDLADLSMILPANNLNAYEGNVSVSANTNYGEILVGKPTGYYEILEIDRAGNTTQYLVWYLATNLTNVDKFSFTINNVKLTAGNKNVTISNNESQIDYDGIGEDKDSVTMFDRGDSVGGLDFVNDTYHDYFYVIEIQKNGRDIAVIKTDLSNQDLPAQLLYCFEVNGFGNYEIFIHSRNHEDVQGLEINYVEKLVDFDIQKIVDFENRRLVLNAANSEENSVTYYIKQFEVRHIFNTETTTTYFYDSGKYYYEVGGEIVETVDNTVPFSRDGSYSIVARDMFEILHSYRFNADGKPTYSVEGVYNQEGSTRFYSYQPIVIKYVDGMYDAEISCVIDGVEKTIASLTNNWYDLMMEHSLLQVEDIEEDGLKIKKLTFSPYYPALFTEDGKQTTVTITLKASDIATERVTYTINFDTRNGKVVLNNTKGVAQNLDVDVNLGNKDDWINTMMTSGTMNLRWEENPTQDFSMKYLLHEKIDEETWIEPIDLTDNTERIHVIQTGQEEKGLYVFEIQVFSKDGSIYLGNKLYIFMVKAVTTDLYTVQSNSREFSANAFLSKIDFDSTQIENIENGLTEYGATKITLPSGEIPMYVSTEELSVVEDAGQGVEKLSYVIRDDSNYKLTIYRVYMPSFSQYLAIMEINESSTLISEDSLKINGEALHDDPVLDINEIEIQFNQVEAYDKYVQKNIIRLEVWFNDEFVKEVIDLNSTNGFINQYRYLIKGSGYYTFKIFDIAGNQHEFSNGEKEFSIYALANKEVAILMNGEAPIENGYFSTAVQLSIIKDGIYESISVSATRNGNPYAYLKNKQVYNFVQSGTYRVNISAVYRINEQPNVLNKMIIFTIINPNEASQSINLNLVEQYKLLTVMNGEENVTAMFNEVISKTQKGSLVTYEALQEIAKVGSMVGKQKYTLTYLVSDGIYPDRTQEFTFSLSNEVPAIKCSLKPGDSSKKQFTVTFNAGLIYNQIGEATLYINDKAFKINQNSPVEIVTITVKEKTDGPGVYNIRLVSGDNILWSQTVELKEPLNASAIIIIVVVSLVVAAGVTTFILLRRKMRIR